MANSVFICATILIFCRLAYGNFFRSDYCSFQAAEGFFKFYPIPMKWEDAVIRCFEEGAILASPIDENMTISLIEIMRNGGMKPGTVIFTGISNVHHRSEFQSMEGIPISSISLTWSGEPEVRPSETSSIVMDTSGISKSVSSSELHGFVCYRKKGYSTRNACGTMDPGFVLDPRTGSCYKVSDAQATWIEAFRGCVIQGATLAIVNSDIEAKVILEVANNAPNSASNQWLHIGFRSWGTKPHWMTIQGESLKDAGYSKWAAGEPNNPLGNGLCGSIYAKGSVESGIFNDDPCDRAPKKYICEINPKDLGIIH